MRVPTLAAFTLAALAVQNWGQQAIAAPQPAIIPPPAEPTDALPREDVPEPTAAIAVPESFVAESSSESIALEDDLVERLDLRLSPEELSPEESRVDAVQEERLSEARLAALTNQESATRVSQTAISQNRTQNRPESGIEIPVQTPFPVQSPGLNAQNQTSPRSATSVQVSIEGQELPVPGVLPISFRFPIRTQIVSNAAIATNTPITDQEFPTPLPRANVGSLEELARYREARTLALTMWANQVRGCLVDEHPNLVSLRRVERPNGTEVDAATPMLLNGRPGRIVRNASGRLVCPIT